MSSTSVCCDISFQDFRNRLIKGQQVEINNSREYQVFLGQGSIHILHLPSVLRSPSPSIHTTTSTFSRVSGLYSGPNECPFRAAAPQLLVDREKLIMVCFLPAPPHPPP